MRISTPALTPKSIALSVLLIGLCPVLEASAAGQGQYERSPVPLRIDKSIPTPSPFRLTIQRSDYRVGGSAASGMGKPHRARGDFSPAIDRHARAQGLDPDLVHAVIRAESAYRPEAVSPKGAIGLMQVMPGTGKRFGVSDLEQPEANLRAGTAYLRHLMDRFNNVPLALAAYNAGEGAVMRHGNQIPPFPETQGYVRSILRDYGESAYAGVARPRVYADGIQLAREDLSEYRLVRSAVK